MAYKFYKDGVKYEYYKYTSEPNGVVYGAVLVNNNGVASDFSSSNYIDLENKFAQDLSTADNWKVQIRIRLEATSKDHQRLIHQEGSYLTGLLVEQTSDKLTFELSLSSSKTTVGKIIDSSPLDTNTWYDVYVTYSSNVGYSLFKRKVASESAFTLVGTLTNTTKANNTKWTISREKSGSNQFFHGSIDLKNTYVIVSGKEIWRGVTTATGTSSDYDYKVTRSNSKCIKRRRYITNTTVTSPTNPNLTFKVGDVATTKEGTTTDSFICSDITGQVGKCTVGTRGNGIISNNGTYLLLSTNSYYSYDGLSWTLVPYSIRNADSSTIYNNTVYVSSPSIITSRMYYSEDMINWTEKDMNSPDDNTNSDIYPVCINNSLIIYEITHKWDGSSMNYVYYKGTAVNGNLDNIKFTKVSYALRDVKEYEDIMFAVKVSSTTSYSLSERSVYSVDGGVTWIDASPKNISNIIKGNDCFIGVQYGSAFYSSDGITWWLASVSNDVSGLAFGNGVFILVGQEDNSSWYSTNGKDWTELELPFYNSEIIFADGKFLAVPVSSSGGNCYTSTDGFKWEPIWKSEESGEIVDLSSDEYKITVWGAVEENDRIVRTMTTTLGETQLCAYKD